MFVRQLFGEYVLKRIVGFAASVTLALGAFAVQGVVPETSPVAPQQAAAVSPRDAVIKNSTQSHRYLRVCKSWSGTAADPGCANGTAYWDLHPGSKTKSGPASPRWSDTDGVYVPNGYKVLLPIAGRTWGPGWHKVGGCLGCTQTLKIVRA